MSTFYQCAMGISPSGVPVNHRRERMMKKLCVVLVLSLSMNLQAQDATSSQPVTAEETSAPRRLRLVSESTTVNYLPKFVDGSGSLADSAIYQSISGLVGIGTTAPANPLHIVMTTGSPNLPLKLETTGGDSLVGIALKNDARNWHIRVDGADGDKFKIHDATASEDRLTIDADGRVGIRTATPYAPLHIYGAANADSFLGLGPDPRSGGSAGALNIGYGGASFGPGSGFFNVRPDSTAVAPNPSLRFGTADVVRMIITNTGRVGVGTSDPQQKMHIWTDQDESMILQVENTNATGTTAHAAFRTLSALSATTYVSHGNRAPSLIRFGIPLAGWSEIVNYNGAGFVMGTTLATPLVFGTYNTERLRIAADGNVGIGTTNPATKLHVVGQSQFDGNAHFNGTVTGTNIRANYQDVAEWVPATTDLAPGTVVILNTERDNEVMASVSAYDTAVAGVVSAQPGLSLGIEGEGKEQIATTGRVKVRVDARTLPIRVGDLLVTSDLPGTAMRSEPMEINGRKFHQPGTIVGKALQPLESGIGEILVLLSMQ